MNFGSKQQGAQAASCCNIFAFVLALYCCISSSWVYVGYVSGTYMYSSTNSLSSAPFIASRSASTVYTTWGWGWNSDNLYYSNIGDEACSSTLTFTTMNTGTNATATSSQFADYFCDGSSFVLPTEAKVIQAFTIITTVLALLSGILGFMIATKGPKVAIAASALSFFAWISSIVAFAQASSWDYYKGLRNGSAGLLIKTTGSTSTYILANFEQGMWWGRTFWAMVIVFVILLFTTGAMISATRNPVVKKDNLDGHLDEQDASKDNEGISISYIQTV
uniref:Uncharacterized protein n=1 Tax=Mucochytrium quahogii TaxID=96639 RepID=A0A7S2RH82_9STRA|mmetsp:Transcript_12931/g.20926  ORF Transcript_12931/g.20926 Transcript_12931/m.20926 type:complete len:277 (+) Transcript_12931:164-994(+)|eukprot:CAMPEP_0203773234 /NCGR_PEP_ID=MMETSP0099_2-20121227/4536_1 /ASSEMBLY_ACC=CAM_ASM_000209 /TAXON_ID=96639 /ORGANISM=" , Strain NY0313808BC1" /LENGTH=276 /DNA_ID=CAMNT_0050671025 /DNA_START=786 /DNA_END=1616 /DNA_ORIENTATION=-